MDRLFAIDQPQLEWVQFEAEGFDSLVCGVVYRASQPPCCGVPLGGISTGCIDVDARGVYGFDSIFYPCSVHPVHEHWRIPRKLPACQPILGLAIGDQAWVLAAREAISGDPIPWCTEPQMLEVRGKEAQAAMVACPEISGVRPAAEIHYWGHYPVADRV